MHNNAIIKKKIEQMLNLVATSRYFLVAIL